MADKRDSKPAKEQKQPVKEQKAPAKEAKAGGEKRPRAKGEGGGMVLEKTKTPKASAGKARLRVHYTESVVPALTKQFNYSNPMAVPKLEKIRINVGLGEATQNPQGDGWRGG